MIIHLSPQRRDDTLEVSRSGDILIINGEPLTFLSEIESGQSVDMNVYGHPWLGDEAKRIDGVLHVTLLLPHGPNPSRRVAFPDPIIDPPDGPIALPRDPVIEGEPEE